MTLIQSGELQSALADLPGWSVEGDRLYKEFKFKTFAAAIVFINRVAEVARAARHHPEIWNSYNRVRLTLTTHDEGGISDKDVAFARSVEGLET
jgi:4a-hydroxytetrahydrobiopterin dehydratase